MVPYGSLPPPLKEPDESFKPSLARSPQNVEVFFVGCQGRPGALAFWGDPWCSLVDSQGGGSPHRFGVSHPGFKRICRTVCMLGPPSPTTKVTNRGAFARVCFLLPCDARELQSSHATPGGGRLTLPTEPHSRGLGVGPQIEPASVSR